MIKYIGLSTEKKVNPLSAQATVQSAFEVESTEKDIFIFEPADVKLQFNPISKTMILFQNGYTFNFTKD